MKTDKETDRQTDILIALLCSPPRGEVTKCTTIAGVQGVQYNITDESLLHTVEYTEWYVVCLLLTCAEFNDAV